MLSKFYPALLFFAVLVVLFLETVGIRFPDSFIFAGIGFGAHLSEDVLIAHTAFSGQYLPRSSVWVDFRFNLLFPVA